MKQNRKKHSELVEQAVEPRVNLLRVPRRLFMGKRVRLLKTVRTKGGDVFKKGRVMVLKDRWGRGFTLEALSGGRWVETLPGCGSRKGWGIKGVDRSSFMVVE